MKRRCQKIIKTALYIIFSFVISVFAIEITYRKQWFDFYKSEWNGLNKFPIDKSKKTILVGGDSFSADPYSYVQRLRMLYPEYNIMNAAIPGTGITQMAYSLPNRIKNVKPDVFIYQIYVGNDLFDIQHPWSTNVSLIRNIYWWTSDRMHVLGYLNYKLAGIRYRVYDDGGGLYKPKQVEVFSKESYSKREKLNFLAEPQLISNTLFLRNGREKQMTTWIKKLRFINKHLPENCKKYIIILPHASQVNLKYLHRMKQIGADELDSVCNKSTYPFYMKLEQTCNELDFILLNPLQRFRELESEDVQLFYENDPHLTILGQQLLGDWVAKNI